MTKKMIAVGLGEVLFDVVKGQYCLGGAPANFAFHCKELGIRSYAIASVGQDSLGDLAIKKLGPIADFISKAQPPFATGCVHANIDELGHATYIFDDDCAFDHLILDEKQLELAKDCTLISFGTLCQRHTQSRKAIYEFLNAASGALKIFDVNLRADFYSQELITASLKYCDLLKVSDEELPVICSMLSIKAPSKNEQELGDLLHQLYTTLSLNFGVQGVALTRGEMGSEIYFKGELSKMKAPVIEVSDTIGAGDSFGAALGCALVSGASLQQAHAIATAVSAYVCTKAGAMVPLPPELSKAL